MKPDDEERQRESNAILKQVDQQSEKITWSTNTTDPAGDENDPIEIWGKRLGRIIGYAFALYLIWHLVTTYVLK